MNQRIDLPGISNVLNGGALAGAQLNTAWIPAAGNTRIHMVVGFTAPDEDITITPAQATDSSGTGTKALDIPYVYTKAASESSFTKVDVAAATYVISSAAAGVVIVEFDVAAMDVNGGFNHINLALTGSTTRMLNVIALPMGGNA